MVGQFECLFDGLIDAVVGLVRDEPIDVAQRHVVLAAQRRSQEGATHAENKAEGDKDMRATEASYVARGQAQRVMALEADLGKVAGMTVRAFPEGAPIALSALVELEGDAGRSVVFLAPAGGGTRLAAGEASVLVVTPAAPLGRALLGAREGDSVEVQKAGAVEVLEILGVA